MNRQQTILTMGGNSSIIPISSASESWPYPASTDEAESIGTNHYRWSARRSETTASWKPLRILGIVGRSYLARLILPMVRAILLVILVVGCVRGARGQSLSSTLTVTLDTSQFNFQNFATMPGYAPGPDTSKQVFCGLIRFQIRRTNDGSFYVAGESRTEVMDVTTGQALTTSGSLTASVERGISVGVKLLTGSQQNGISTTIGASNTTNSSISANVMNQLAITSDGGGCVSADVIYTTPDGVKHAAQIPLGYVDDDGDFVAFTGGDLQGKVIIADRGLNGNGNVVSDRAPGKAFWTHERGFLDNQAAPVSAWVQTGWIVSVASQGGVVVGVAFEPAYEFRIVGFRIPRSPYKAVNGKVVAQ